MIKRLALLMLLCVLVIGWQIYPLTPATLKTSVTNLWPNVFSKAKHTYSTTDATYPSEMVTPPKPQTDQQKNPVQLQETNLQKQTSLELLQNLENRLAQSNIQQIPIVSAALAQRLQKHRNPEIYQYISGLLSQPDVPIENKSILLDLLAETATPDALDLLLDLAKQGANTPFYILALQAISRIGDNRWDGRFHEELSPALEEAWADPSIKDPAFLGAVGKAIAEVGAPGGVNQLLVTVSGHNPEQVTPTTGLNGQEVATVSGNNQVQEPAPTSLTRQEVALEVIPHVQNPVAVSVLTDWFQQEPLGAPAFETSANALIAIGTPAATQTIVDWAVEAPAEGARNLEDWLHNVDDTSTIVSIATEQNLNFKTPEVAAVFTGAVASFTANPGLSNATDPATATSAESDETPVLPLLPP